jgi:radical SAM protein with 4Fe4S-binding SPASM domain
MECPYIPVLKYDEFGKRLQEQTKGRRVPLGGSIEVTARCNLQCVQCYINQPIGDSQARNRELSKQELYSILDQITDEGCLWLLLTGGEPFIRPDFFDIYTYAKKKGMLITLFTNGTTITPRIADYLAEWRPSSIEVTLYGSTKETYERVTGVYGSYEHCMRGIDLLMERKLPLTLKSMIMTLNKHEVGEMKAYAESLGVDFRFDPVVNMRLDGDRGPKEFRILPEEIVELDLKDEERLKEWKEFCSKFLGLPQNPEYLYQCGAGLEVFHIDPHGQLFPCMMARMSGFDLRHGKFSEGWHAFIPRIIEQKWSQDIPCKKCYLLSLCDQCPGWAYVENGDQERPVKYLCHIAHMRGEAFGLSSFIEKGGEI